MVLFQVQAAEMGFSREVYGMALHDKKRRCVIRKTFNTERSYFSKSRDR